MQQDQASLLRFWFAIATGCINIGILVLVVPQGDHNAIATTCMSLAFLLGSYQFSELIFSDRLRPLSFSLLLYWLYGLLLPGLYQARVDDYFWQSIATSEDLATQAGLIMLISSVFLFLGMSLNPGNREFVLKGRQIDPYIGARFALMIGFGILLYCLFLLAWLGPEVYFLPRELAGYALRAKIGTGSSLIGAFVRTFPMALAITLMGIALSLLKTQAVRRSGLLLLLFAFVSNMIVNFPAAVPRYFLVALMLVILILGFPKFFKSSRIFVYISAPIMLYLVFPTLGRWNRGAESGQMSIVEYLADGDLDGFQSVLNAVHLVDENGLSFGNRILSSLFFYVPRGIWPGKAEATGAEAAEAAGYSFLNISMPLPGELYADFGMFGAAIGMFLFGLLVRGLERGLDTPESELSMTKIFAAAFAGFLPIIARGPLLSTVQALAVCMIVLWFWNWQSQRMAARQLRDEKAREDRELRVARSGRGPSGRAPDPSKQ